jgi:hypothetical protein
MAIILRDPNYLPMGPSFASAVLRLFSPGGTVSFPPAAGDMDLPESWGGF